MTDQVVVVRVPTIVTAAAPGPQGPVGPAGPQGPAGTAGGTVVTHIQSTPAATWVIDHGLGRKVHVTVFDGSGNVVYTDVTHGTPDQTTLTFPSPVAGSAVLS